MKNFLDRFVNGLLSNPKKSILLGVLFTAIFIPGLFKVEPEFSYKGYYRADHPLIVAFNQFEKTFGGDDRIAIVVHSEKGIFNQNHINTIIELTDKMWEVSDIIRVDSLSNYNYTRAEGDDIVVSPFLEDEELTDEFISERKKIALSDEILPNYLISEDAKTTMVIGRFRPIFEGKVHYDKGIDEIRNIVKEYESKSDLKFYLAGNAMVNNAFKEVSSHDLKLIIPVLSLVIMILLIYTFKNMVGIFLPLIVIATSNIVTFGAAGYLGIQYSNITSAIPIILIAISIADTIHILLTFYQFKNEGYSSKEAAFKASRKNLIPTFLTSVSTAIGFISLSSSQLLPIFGLGILGFIGSMSAWVLSFLIVVPCLTYISDKRKKKLQSINISESFVKKYTEFIKKYARWVCLSFVALSGLTLYIGLQNEVNSDPLIYLSEKVPFRVATEFLDHNLGGVSGVEVVINSGSVDGAKDPIFMKKIETLEDWMKERHFYTRIISYVDIVKSLNRALEQGKSEEYRIPDDKNKIAQELFLYGMSVPQGKDINDQITVDNSTVRVTGLWTVHSSKLILEEINLINAKVKELGLDGYVSGKMPVYHNMNNFVVQTFFQSILSAIFLIGLMMVFLFKSVRIGVMSMIPNVVPLFVGGAAMYLMNKPLDIGTVIIGAICLGIAIDDTLHFLISYSNYRKSGADKFTAVEQTLYRTGVALVGTTVILICGFASFLLADFVPNMNLGIGTMIVLFVALVTDLVLLPAILFVTKRF